MLRTLVRQGCTVFRVPFSPMSSRRWYQMKAVFQDQAVKAYCKGIFLVDCVIFRLNFYVLEYAHHQFSLESVIILRENSWRKVNKSFSWAHPRPNLSQVPPPPRDNESNKLRCNNFHCFDRKSYGLFDQEYLSVRQDDRCTRDQRLLLWQLSPTNYFFNCPLQLS